MSLAVTKKKKSIVVLAWIAPIVALIISVSMVYDYFTKIGNQIEITFKNIEGLDLRQSHIQYNGLHIGDINSIKIDQNDINKFTVKATIYSGYNYLIKKGTIFYKVSPELSLSGASALSNVLKGNYIEIIPPTTDLKKLEKIEKQFVFKGYDTQPKQNGIRFNLTSSSGDFDITSAILYKGLQIGEILNKTLDKFSINYEVLIYEKYKYLISSSTKFYKINPLEFKSSLDNIDLKIPSLKNMISSNIGFVTPSADEDIQKSYTLYDSKADIELKNDNTNLYSFKIFSNDLVKNDLVFYRGIVVGKINKVKLQKDTNIVYGYIQNRYKYLINDSTVFYKQKAISTDISTDGIKIDVSNLKSMVLGGLTFITPKQKEKLSSHAFTYYENIDTYYKQNSFDITLKLKENHNIKKTSKLFYKNVEIGFVNSIELEKDIIITLKIQNKYKYLFGKDAKIYLKGVKISLDKIDNLSSTILGDNLYLIADSKNRFKSTYTLDSINPDETHYEKGLRVTLKANESKNISIGSPIYYKGFEVGKIYDADLTTNGESVIFNLFIKEQYANIVQPTSKFYKATTIDMDVGAFGAKIKFGSAKSMLRGGIMFENEKATATVTSAQDGMEFELLEKED